MLLLLGAERWSPQSTLLTTGHIHIDIISGRQNQTTFTNDIFLYLTRIEEFTRIGYVSKLQHLSKGLSHSPLESEYTAYQHMALPSLRAYCRMAEIWMDFMKQNGYGAANFEGWLNGWWFPILFIGSAPGFKTLTQSSSWYSIQSLFISTNTIKIAFEQSKTCFLNGTRRLLEENTYIISTVFRKENKATNTAQPKCIKGVSK